MDVSPGKRSVLGPIDSNARNSAMSNHEAVKPATLPDSPDRLDCGAVKRPLGLLGITDQHQECPPDQPAKRQRVSPDEKYQFMMKDRDARVDSCDDHYEGESGNSNSNDNDNDNGNGNGNGNDDESHDSDNYIGGQDSYIEHLHSVSADEASSIFDNSVIDTSQVTTTLTEPDTEVITGSPPESPHRQHLMSREEARQKAEKLRLRLGLASYKVRTGQTDVPLDQLKVKPLVNASKPRHPEQLYLPPLPRREEDNYEKNHKPSIATRQE
ncbi:hypothetical protein F5Y02DRAFT_387975 [Annulohypoxylon stygium]|nr:hypothetical protein F5Y02DRAFT_387975 [Annulohypoxylon stygium]